MNRSARTPRPGSRSAFHRAVQAWTWLLPLIGALVLLGCASVEGGQPFDKVITQETDLYRTSLNDSVTERRLEVGTRVRVEGMSGDGKLEIVTMSGDRGFVDRSSVADMPDNPAAHNQN